MFHHWKMFFYSLDPKVRFGMPLLLTFLLGILGGSLIQFDKPNQTEEVRSPENTYTYINPLLACENSSFENVHNVKSLENQVQQRIDQGTDNNELEMVAVYYRDLNNGPWFGINEREEFSPASLIKVPLLIALFKQAETDPTILDKEITITTDLSYEGLNFTPAEKLVSGKTYTVKQLMERMIIDSDNYAYDLLLQEVKYDVISRVYEDLGINVQQINEENPSGNILSVRDYAGFFRVLFNASYISNEYSEEALALLSNTTFREGLPAGTEPGTKVAHKFGERYYLFSGIRQLHDCGIVYHPKRPYLLCVMTKGSEFSALTEVIKDISKIVYEENSKQ